MANDEELKYIADHPGGFDREFFEEHLPGLIEQWRKWASVSEDGYLVEIRTSLNKTFGVAYARAALTYGAFFTEDFRLELVPYKEIASVTLRARPKKAEPRSVGFTATSI